MTGNERNDAVSDVPTMSESGVKNWEVVGFYGVPADVIAQLGDALRKTLAVDHGRTRMVQQRADPAFLDSAQFTQFLQSEGAR